MSKLDTLERKMKRLQDPADRAALLLDNLYEIGLAIRLGSSLVGLDHPDALARFIASQLNISSRDPAGPLAGLSAEVCEALSADLTAHPLPDDEYKHRIILTALAGLGAPGLHRLRDLSGARPIEIAHAIRVEAPRLVHRGLAPLAVEAIAAWLTDQHRDAHGRLLGAAADLGAAAAPLIPRVWPRWPTLPDHEREPVARLLAAAGGPDLDHAAALLAAWDAAIAGAPHRDYVKALCEAISVTGRGAPGAWERMAAGARDDRWCGWPGEALWRLWEGGASQLALAALFSHDARERLREISDEPALISRFEDGDALVARGALHAAAGGAPSPALVAALSARVGDPRREVSQDALWALYQLAERGDGAALDALIVALSSPDDAVSARALQLLRPLHGAPVAPLLALMARGGAIAPQARQALAKLKPSALLPRDTPLTAEQQAELDKFGAHSAAPCPLGLDGGERLPLVWLELWRSAQPLPGRVWYASTTSDPANWFPEGAAPEGLVIFASDGVGEYAWAGAVWFLGGEGELVQVADSMEDFLWVLSAGVERAGFAARDVQRYRAEAGADATPKGFAAWLKARRLRYEVDKGATRALGKWLCKRLGLQDAPTLLEAVSAAPMTA
jgi:hypothetical protein